MRRRWCNRFHGRLSEAAGPQGTQWTCCEQRRGVVGKPGAEFFGRTSKSFTAVFLGCFRLLWALLAEQATSRALELHHRKPPANHEAEKQIRVVTRKFAGILSERTRLRSLPRPVSSCLLPSVHPTLPFKCSLTKHIIHISLQFVSLFFSLFSSPSTLKKTQLCWGEIGQQEKLKRSLEVSQDVKRRVF